MPFLPFASLAHVREEGRRGGRERERGRRRGTKKKRFVVLYIYKLPINRQRGQMLIITIIITILIIFVILIIMTISSSTY